MNGFNDVFPVSTSTEPYRKKTDEELEKLARAHSFRKKNRFSKEVLYIFETVYSNYAKNLISNLSIRFRSNINIHLESIRPMIYNDYAKTIASDSVISTFTLSPMNGMFLLIFNNEFGYLCIDALCGGGFIEGVVNKEFTDVEKTILKIVSESFVQPQQYYWREFLNVTTSVKSVDYNPISVQFIEDSESVLVVNISLEVGGYLFPVQMIFPYSSIENVVEELSAANRKNDDTKEPNDKSRDAIKHHILDSGVSMNAILGQQQIPVSSVTDFNVGDTIVFDRKVDDLLELLVEDEEAFLVQLGLSNGKKAVQIMELKEEGAQ